MTLFQTNLLQLISEPGHIPYKTSFQRHPGKTRAEWFLIRMREVAPRTPCSFCRESVFRQAIRHCKPPQP